MNAGFGYASGALNHPDINESTFSGPGMEISVGTELDPKLRLSVAFSAYEMKLELGPGQKYIQKSYAAHGGSGLHTLKNPELPVLGAGDGGALWRTPFHLSTLGPRLDYLPFGDHGPYVGVTLGMGMIPEIKPLVGAAAAARIGGEYRFLKAMGIGAEAGAYGHLYDGVRAALPYVQVRVTLMIDPATVKGLPTSPVPVFKPLR